MRILIIRFLIPILIILLLCYLFLTFPGIRSILSKTYDTDHSVQSVKASDYYPSLTDHPEAWIAIKNILEDSNGILMLGSSELTSEDPNGIKSFKFIPNYTHYPVIAIGHAGNQAFSMFAQLLTMHHSLENANVLIILSPIWYLGKNASGTSLDIFLEFIPQNALRKIIEDQEIPDTFKQYIYTFISKKYPDLISPSPELKLMNYYHKSNISLINHLAYSPLISINKYYLKYSESIDNTDLLNNNDLPLDFNKSLVPRISTSQSISINWDSLKSIYTEYHVKSSTSNSWGINDTYYMENVHGEHGAVKTVPMSKNKELQDLKVLVELLTYYKVNASFVMQAVNPFYYDQLRKFKPIDDSIKNIINTSPFPYYNMLEYDSTIYQKAILTDVMHMSEVGWLTVNEFIINKLMKHEKRN